MSFLNLILLHDIVEKVKQDTWIGLNDRNINGQYMFGSDTYAVSNTLYAHTLVLVQQARPYFCIYYTICIKKMKHLSPNFSVICPSEVTIILPPPVVCRKYPQLGHHPSNHKDVDCR